MADYNNIEMKLYHDCLFEIKKRIDVIASYLNGEKKNTKLCVLRLFVCNLEKSWRKSH